MRRMRGMAHDPARARERASDQGPGRTPRLAHDDAGALRGSISRADLRSSPDIAHEACPSQGLVYPRKFARSSFLFS